MDRLAAIEQKFLKGQAAALAGLAVMTEAFSDLVQLQQPPSGLHIAFSAPVDKTDH